jgi:hypothetical protein
MSNFRVCKMKLETQTVAGFVKFDDKEDAEHYAKNQSVSDLAHSYEVQKNNEGEFTGIKAYQNGQEL